MTEVITTKLSAIKRDTRISTITSQAAVHYLVLAGITLLAAAMRFYKLGEWSFWIDEIYTLNYAGEVVRYVDLQAPLSVWLAAGALRLFGESHWSARLVAALIGVLSIPILYFPVKKLFGAAIALLGMFFLAISPWHLYWSQNTRFYTALMLFYTLALFALYYWIEEDRFRYLVYSGLLAFLAFLERSLALFIAPVGVVYAGLLLVLPFEKARGIRWRNLLLLAVPGLLFGLYLVFGTNLIQGFTGNILGHRHNPFRVLLGLIYDVGLPLFILALLGGAYLFIQKSRIGLYLLISLLVPLALLVMITPFTQAFSRYVFITLPSYTILGAVAAREIIVQTQKHAKILAVGVLLLLVADPFSQDVLYYSYQNGNREDWKGAFAVVQELKVEDDLVATTRPELGEYYLGQEMIDARIVDHREFVRRGERTWLVIDNRSYVPPRLENWIAENTELMGVHDVYLPGKTLMMRVYLYDPLEH